MSNPIIPLHEHRIYNIHEITDYLLKKGVESDRCLIVFERHWPHNNNLTEEPYLQMGRQIGRITERLFALGAVISSPEPPAIEAAIAFQSGRDKRLPIKTFDELGVLSNEDPELIKKLIKDASSTKRSAEEFFLIHDDWREMRDRRGLEGAVCVLDNLTYGQALLVTSHGGFRLEPTIRTLTGRGHYPKYMGTGDICLLLINKEFQILSERYLVFNGHGKRG